MKILSMTATFGKLEHDTLTLKPGLNLIHAPNEWGKSTWCAFLLAMLYGLDTRTKATRTTLAEKVRFAPWSGKPMSGRIDLLWNGREITIERTTSGRTPLGVFHAYETGTGLAVPQLTAANCGQVLLGVEPSVFRRAGFVRLSDLPVTEDEALRRRLNALVTTGDESGDAARLEQGLRDLKKKCRSRQNGLLPQAQRQRDTVQSALDRLSDLQARQQTLTANLAQQEALQRSLENHIATLAWEKSQQNVRRCAQAQADLQNARACLSSWEARCAGLPQREHLQARFSALLAHRDRLLAFQTEPQPMPPGMPRVPKPFLGMEPQEAMNQAVGDAASFRAFSGPLWWLLLIFSLLFLVGGGALFWLGQTVSSYACGAASAMLLLLSLLRRRWQSRGKRSLFRKYGSHNPSQWMQLARDYCEADIGYRRSQEAFLQQQADRQRRQDQLKAQHRILCAEASVDAALQECRQLLDEWAALDQSQAQVKQAQTQYSLLKSLVRDVPAPTEPDKLTLSHENSLARLHQSRQTQQQLLTLLGECSGAMASLGSEAALKQELTDLNARIAALQQLCDAVDVAQQTLSQATAELQRRFSPKITHRAQELLGQLTLGRYDRLKLGNDLTLRAAAAQEDTLHDALWRSEGTIDQLYLALRLAVAEALTPDAPLILDDALVRFDDDRLRAALQVLTDLSQTRQVILFTCQQREQLCLQQAASLP